MGCGGHIISKDVWILSSLSMCGPEKNPLFLCGLHTVALGKGITLLSLPHIHLPPTITPIEPRSLGGATLIFTTHLHPPATTIPTGNIISLHILCIQHKGVGECAVCRCLCGCGRAQMFPSMYTWLWQVCCEKSFKEGLKRYNASGVHC